MTYRDTRYDTDLDGQVESAKTADFLEGYSSSEFLKAAETNSDSFDSNSTLIVRGIGGTSDYNVAVQDGNGRVHHYWNVEESTQNVITDGEGASWLRLSGGSVEIRTHAGYAGDAGSPANWDHVFEANGNGIYEFNERVATRTWVNNNATTVPITVSSTAPSNPSTDDIWIDTS
jgi:hypothetical protein